MSAFEPHETVRHLTAIQRRSLQPERLPEFPPRAEIDALSSASRGRRGGRLLGMVGAVMIAGAGAGLVVSLIPDGPKAHREAAEPVAKADTAVATGTTPPRAATVVEAAPTIAHTGAVHHPAPSSLATEAQNPAAPVARPEAERVEVRAPVVLPAPVVVASAEPIELVTPSPVPAPVPAPTAGPVPAPVPVPLASAKVQSFNALETSPLVAKADGLLRTGDLASARLFFGRAANAGDPKGAAGMARTFDPEVLRKLPVYGLAANQAEADKWYRRARELETGKAFAQQ